MEPGKPSGASGWDQGRAAGPLVALIEGTIYLGTLWTGARFQNGIISARNQGAAGIRRPKISNHPIKISCTCSLQIASYALTVLMSAANGNQARKMSTHVHTIQPASKDLRLSFCLERSVHVVHTRFSTVCASLWIRFRARAMTTRVS